jgi:outer membrane protein assembly factor BamB
VNRSGIRELLTRVPGSYSVLLENFLDYQFVHPACMKTALLTLLLTGAALSSQLPAADWPSWRGPTQDGICTEKGLPTRWSSTENISWKTPLPERGNSSPVVFQDRIFITQSLSKEKKRQLWCLDRKTGALLWKQGLAFAQDEMTHATNPQCSASPATDGQRVVASFGSAGVVAYDMAGKKLWHRDLGLQTHIWGNAASPVLAGDYVFLNFGPGPRTFLIALNANTGETLWQHDEPGGHSGSAAAGEKKGSWLGSWSDPLLRKTTDRYELLMSYPGRVCSFDPKSGKELWTCSGLNSLVYTSPLYSDGIVVSMGGYQGKALAVRAGGSGDVSSQRLWLNEKSPQRIGSGVIHEGHIYIHNDPGTLMCMELATGKTVWSERVKGGERSGTNWSSVMLADGLCYTINQGGDCIIFRASPQYELVSVNPLGEHSNSSIAASQGQLFIRTAGHLWCVGR